LAKDSLEGSKSETGGGGQPPLAGGFGSSIFVNGVGFIRSKKTLPANRKRSETYTKRGRKITKKGRGLGRSERGEGPGLGTSYFTLSSSDER